jgi:hypothetical protein
MSGDRSRSNTSFTSVLWEQICGFRQQLFLLLALLCSLFVLSVIAVPFVTPGSASSIVLAADLVGLSAVILLVVGLLWRCSPR